ncbi:hypothetical protein [Microbacterium sp. Clip185]|uniref:hypothetical protein n=1 Tax=Microbacterium sp. Clip185 TaxID=3025663 RepID=UPI0023658B1C|nr:hypothetical protein [Microbacterium sp. Clip185]WDG18467.1 hypothetical protein PQV94_01700 [Microbacterium sp. Clip185]
MLPFGSRRREADAAARRATRPVFESRGWQWEDAAPPPSIEIAEAAFRATTSDEIWPTGMSEVVTGQVNGREITAARLVGYVQNRGNLGNAWGDRYETNLVWMRLPASLPEIRFGDQTLRRRNDYGIKLTPRRPNDYGIKLPPIPPLGPVWPSTRWSVEGFIPAFAQDLLTPAFVAALEAAPERSPIVIRAGVILTYGAETLDVASVDARIALLASLVDAVPAAAWGRADALVAGTGVFPIVMQDGAALRLDDRLVARDWKGYGLSKVDWRDTPTAKSSVVMKLGEVREVWDEEPPNVAPTGFTVRFDRTVLAGGPIDRGIPTVKSTLTQS